MTAPWWGAQVAALLGQDLRREWRGRAVLGVMVPFALSTGLALNFTFNLALEAQLPAAVGAFWTALLFAMILGLGRAWAGEQENGVWEGLTLAPVGAGGLFLAKLLSNLAWLLVLDGISIPVFAGLYNLPLLGAEPLLSVALGTLALSAIGTLFVPLAGQTRAREIVLPVILLPVLTPVIIGAVAATTAALSPPTPGQPPWIGLLVACSALFGGAGYLLYGQLLGD